MPRHDHLAIREAKSVIKALDRIAPERLKNAIPELEAEWSKRAFEFHQRAHEAAEQGEHNAAQRYTWAAGVSTDKLVALKDRPQPTVLHFHQHHHDLGPVLSRLAGVLVNAPRAELGGASAGALAPSASVGADDMSMLPSEPAPSVTDATQLSVSVTRVSHSLIIDGKPIRVISAQPIAQPGA